MIPKESDKAVRIHARCRIKAILGEKFGQVGRCMGARREPPHSSLKSEIQDRRHAGAMNKFGKKRRVGIVHFAKNKKILTSGFLRSLLDGRHKALPELVVDVLHRLQTASADLKH